MVLVDGSSLTLELEAARSAALAVQVVAIEILAACQAIDLLAPLRTPPALAGVHALVRRDVPRLTTIGRLRRTSPRSPRAARSKRRPARLSSRRFSDLSN